MIKNILSPFFSLYIILSTIIASFFLYDYSKSFNLYLKQESENNYLKFKAIYNRHKEISNIIFDADINTTEVLEIFKNAYKSDDLGKNIIREQLLKKLEEKYKKLKKYNLKQVHFHLPNNESFLRMHRPKKFGDNLTGIRETVVFVNKNKAYFDGFEEGRIFNGFRFVYPLFWEKEHIGSVEISFSALALINSFHDTFNLDSTFLIKKDVVDKKVFEEEKKNYIQSSQKDFYYEKSIYDAFPPINELVKSEDTTKITLQGNPYSTFLESKNYVETVIPLRNPITENIVAAFCIYSKDTFLANAKKNLAIMVFSTYFSLLIIFYLFYIQRNANKKLKVLNRDLDRRILIEIKKSKRKDLHIQNQTKLAAVGEMLNHIAHQWRQPLNVISTGASGLQMHKEIGTLDDKTFDLLTNSIKKQTQYLSKTIENFKDHLNIENSTKITKLCVQEAIENTLEILYSTLEYNNIKIEKNIEARKLYIKASQNQITQILLNILNNSKEALIKNNEIDNRKIIITLKSRKDFLILTIEDNGGGIENAILDKIFDPYFTTKHESVGTGISLYISYEVITNDLKGKIYVKNKDDGAKSYIEIPLHHEKDSTIK